MDVPEGKGETILVVEDETAILELTIELLENLAYTVLGTNIPSKALHLAEAQGSAISLLLTDVAMPEMSGIELAEQLKQLCPKIRILFMSGCSVNEIFTRDAWDRGVNLIQKPFSISDLAVKIRAVLDEKSS